MKHRLGGEPGTYRFGANFIQLTTAILIIVMLGMLIVGFIISALSYNAEGQASATLSTVAVILVGGGITVPLLVAAILGGEAIKRGGGVIGCLLIVGLFSTVAATTDIGKEFIGAEWLPLLKWGGVALMALSGVGFWIIGWIAKVPMWLQAPTLESPRVYIRGSSDRPADVVLPNELDGHSGTKH